MLDVADQVSPEHRQKFEEVSLSRRTVARRIKAIGEDLTSQLKGLVPSFQLFSLALDESTDIDDTAQLLIFVRGISENFEITKELLSMESMKDTTTGKDIFECVENAFRTMELPWQKMVSVTGPNSYPIRSCFIIRCCCTFVLIPISYYIELHACYEIMCLNLVLK